MKTIKNIIKKYFLISHKLFINDKAIDENLSQQYNI